MPLGRVKTTDRQRFAFSDPDPARVERAAFSHVEIPLSEDDAPPTEFRLWAAGENPTTKGVVLFDTRAADLVAAGVQRRAVDFMVDYEHASLALLTVDPAESGKAAGWFKPAIRDGALWATNVTWTEAATAKINAREFRYISPAGDIERTEDGKVRFVELLNAALTNNPATLAATPLVASHTAGNDSRTEEPTMLKRLLAVFSLAETGTEDDVLSAITRTRDGLSSLLTLSGKPTAAEALGVFQAWKGASEQVQALAEKVSTLEASAVAAERDALIRQALTDGKLTPAMVEKWAKDQPVAMLRAFLDAAPKIAASTATEPEPKSLPAVVSDSDRQVAALCGVKPEQLADYRKSIRA